MKLRYVSNAFSLQMIDDGIITIKTISMDQFNTMKLDAYSVMGHPDMAKLYELPFNRESIKLRQGDELLVAQITSGRLPVGITVMPDDVMIEFKLVTVI